MPASRLRWLLLSSLCVCVLVLQPVTAAAQATSPSWTSQTLADRVDYSVASIGEQVLIAGGRPRNTTSPTDQVDVYDASTSTWSSAQLSQPRWGMAAASVGTQVVFAGGSTDTGVTDAVDVYDSSTGQWSAGALSTPRQYVAAAVVGSQVLFAGGNADHALSNVVDIYDSSTGAWSAGQLSSPSMLTQFSFQPAAFTTVGTQALFWAYPGNGPRMLDTYDATTGEWAQQAAPFGSPRVAVVGQRAVFISGDGNVDIYDAGTGQWSHTTLSQKRDSYALATVGTRLLIAGGFAPTGPSTGAGSDVVDIYDSARDQWSTAQLSQARSDLDATVVGTHAFFAGGVRTGVAPPRPGTLALSDVVDIYDAGTGRWSSAQLSQARMNIAAAAVGTHAILAGGSIPGVDRTQDTPSAVVDDYDLVAGTWSRSSLATARAQANPEQVGHQLVLVGGAIPCRGCAGLSLGPVVDIYSPDVDQATGEMF